MADKNEDELLKLLWKYKNELEGKNRQIEKLTREKEQYRSLYGGLLLSQTKKNKKVTRQSKMDKEGNGHAERKSAIRYTLDGSGCPVLLKD